MEALQSSRTTPEGAEAVPGNPHKAPRMEAQPDNSSSSSSSSRKSSFKGLFEEILQEHGEERGASSTSTQVQIQTYLTEQTVPRSDSPYQYWGVNQTRFPTLAATAAKFLCAPCTSVDSERLCRKEQVRRRESRNAHLPEEESAFALEIMNNSKLLKYCNV